MLYFFPVEVFVFSDKVTVISTTESSTNAISASVIVLLVIVPVADLFAVIPLPDKVNLVTINLVFAVSFPL